MQGCTKWILYMLIFSLCLYLFYNSGILKSAVRKTINKVIGGSRNHSNELELSNKRRHTSEGEERMLNNVVKVKNYVKSSQSRSETSQVKVLLLAYGRTGSSLTGDLISANTSSSYFFEPFW